MMTIQKNNSIVTQMNYFKVVRGCQQELVDRLIRFHAEWWSRQPGHIAVATHKSLDGTMVFNYVQYASQEQLDAAHRHPAFWKHRNSFAHLIIESDPKTYAVTDIQVAQAEGAS